jgi:glycosyltransferase involved in cell wall biosynthesis
VEDAAVRVGPLGRGRAIHLCIISPLGYGLFRSDSRQPFGGAEAQAFLLAQELSRDPSFRITVLTTVDDDSGEERYGRITLVKRRARHRAVAVLPPGLMNKMAALGGYSAAYQEMRSSLRGINADLYVHAGCGVEVGAYALICRQLGRRFVSVVASSSDLDRPWGTASGVLRWLYPLGLKLAHAVVCRTKEQQELLLRRYGRHGVLIRTGYPIPSAQRGETAGGRSEVLWVGRLHPVKRPGRFLDLAERFPDLRFIMIGMTDSTQRELLETVRARTRSISNLTYVEDVPWRQCEAWFRGARILVNTSEYEGFPNTFVQAALAEIPIVSLSVDPDGVLSRRDLGACASGAFEQLVALVRTYCDDPIRRREAGRRARAYAVEYHDVRWAAEQFKDLARQLTSPMAESA